jgi:hypothetical protein
MQRSDLVTQSWALDQHDRGDCMATVKELSTASRSTPCDASLLNRPPKIGLGNVHFGCERMVHELLCWTAPPTGPAGTMDGLSSEAPHWRSKHKSMLGIVHSTPGQQKP